MSTYYIYHIPDRKVGCTNNILSRMRAYERSEGQTPEYEILEILSNVTQQYAGDREHWWAEKLGYKREVHYSMTRSASYNGGLATTKLRLSEMGKKGGPKGGNARAKNLTKEQIAEIGRIGGKISGRHNAETYARDKWSEMGKKGGLIGGRKGGLRAGELGLTACQQQSVCPHCGITTSLANLHRWHFDRCPKRPRPTLRRPT